MLREQERGQFSFCGWVNPSKQMVPSDQCVCKPVISSTKQNPVQLELTRRKGQKLISEIS